MEEAKKIKALIIEDDSYISDMYRIKLESVNIQVVVAEDGMKGMKELEKDRFDVVLLDIIMPKVDGFSVLKMIKKDPNLKDIPVILLTNLGQKESVEKGIELGAADYIIKAHFTPSEVVEKVIKVIENGNKKK